MNGTFFSFERLPTLIRELSSLQENSNNFLLGNDIYLSILDTLPLNILLRDSSEPESPNTLSLFGQSLHNLRS